MDRDTVGRPGPTEFAPPFGVYIALAPEGPVLPFLERQLAEVHAFVGKLDDAQALAHHAPYTWSIKQVIGHVTDCERVFGYRALLIARNDQTPMVSFDENAWMRQAQFDRLPIGELVDEFDLVRRSHLAFFRHLQPEAWLRHGVVLGHPASVRAFAYAMAGHAKHHLDIVRKRLSGPA